MFKRNWCDGFRRAKKVRIYDVYVILDYFHFLFLDNIEKNHEIIKLSLEYFWKYYGKYFP